MGSIKKLNKNDIVLSPYIANKQWDFSYTTIPEPNDPITIYRGVNSIFSPNKAKSSGEYETLMYNQINQVFYQNYGDLTIDSGSLSNSLYYEDVTGVRSSQSFFQFNENPNFVSNFPTEDESTIYVIKVDQKIFGSKLKPSTISLISSTYNITDDGFGNLFDTGQFHIGNIFYSHGILVITHPDYQNIFPIVETFSNTTWIGDLNSLICEI